MSSQIAELAKRLKVVVKRELLFWLAIRLTTQGVDRKNWARFQKLTIKERTTTTRKQTAPFPRGCRGARLHVHANWRDAPHHEHQRPQQASTQDAPCDGRHSERRPRGGVRPLHHCDEGGNPISNFEGFDITTLFTYLRVPIKLLVARINAISTDVRRTSRAPRTSSRWRLSSCCLSSRSSSRAVSAPSSASLST